MIIKQLDVYGYGKWRQMTFPSFGKTQLVYGPNEAGKSTMMAFIEAILFGFPTNKSSERRLEPKDYDGFGGRIIVETDDGDVVTIERKKGKATGDVTLYFADGSRGDETELTHLLQGMTKQMFKAIYSFDIHGLQNVQALKESDFNRYLLAAGTVGSDVLLRVDNQLQKKREDIFKPNGRKPLLNKKLNMLKELEQKYKQSKENNGAFSQLTEQAGLLEHQLEQWQKKDTDLGIKQEQYTDYLSKWSVFEEAEKGQQTLKKLAVTRFPTDGLEQMKALVTEQGQLENEAYQLELALNEVLRQMVETSQFETLDWDEVEPYLADWSLFQERERRLMALRNDNKSEPLANQPLTALTESDLAEVAQLVQKYERLRWQLQQNQHASQTLNTKIELQQLNCDEIEEKLQPEGNHTDVPNAPVFGRPVYLSVFAIVVTVLIGALIHPLFYLIATGILVILLLNYRSQRFKRETVLTKTPPSTEWEKIWQQQCAVLDELQFTKAEHERTNEHLVEQSEATWQRLYHYAQQAKLSIVQTDTEGFLIAFNTCFNEQRQWQQKQGEQQQVTELIMAQNEWLNGLQAATVTVQSELDWDDITATLERLLQEQRAYHQQTEAAINARQEKEQLLRNKTRIEATLQRNEQKQAALLADANVSDTKAFYHKAELKKQAEVIKTRLTVLQMQVSTDERQALREFASKTAILEAIAKLKEERLTIQKERQIAQTTLLELKHQIGLLTKGEVFADIAHEYFLLKSEVAALSQEWMRYKTAQTIVNEMVERLQAERLPQVLNKASEFLSYLTEGRYYRIDFFEDELLVQRRDKFQFKGEELSQGTKEQLYLAIRFAFIDVLEATISLPIIIDDSFVNFDKRRTDLIMKLLERIKDKQQIIYFTCHAYMKDYLPADQCLDLTSYLQPTDVR